MFVPGHSWGDRVPEAAVLVGRDLRGRHDLAVAGGLELHLVVGALASWESQTVMVRQPASVLLRTPNWRRYRIVSASPARAQQVDHRVAAEAAMARLRE